MAKSPLYGFIRKHCANWDGKECFFYGRCKITEAEPCEWFEKYVWAIGDPSYPYAFDVTGYEKRLKAYLTINKHFRYRGKKNRLCECGVALPARRRMCDSCRETHAAENRKKYKTTRSVGGELT